MKTLLSLLLGLMLLTSLVGISYAAPTVQPTQGSGCNPNSPTCDGQSGPHFGNPPPSPCTITGQKGPDFACCPAGITPHSSETYDIHTDGDDGCAP